MRKMLIVGIIALLLIVSSEGKTENKIGMVVDYTPYSQRLLEESNERAKLAEAKRIEAEKKAEEARLKAEAEKKKVEEKVLVSNSRGSQKITFYLSFYTSLPNENGGYNNLANGEPVTTAKNAVASNYYRLGTSITLEGYGTFIVKDRGGKSFNSPQRLDVLVLRKSGESDSEYKKRVMAMGRKTVTGWIN